MDEALDQVELNWTDPYGFWNGCVGLKIGFGILECMIIASGTLLIIGILSYEKYGGDPQKRGILNRIISQVFGMVLVFAWTTTLIALWRSLIGPIGFEPIMWIQIGMIFTFHFFLIISVSEYLLVKYVSIVVIKSMPLILDDLVDKFLLAANLSTAMVLSTVQCHFDGILKLKAKYQGVPGFVRSGSPGIPTSFVAPSMIPFVALLLFTVYNIKKASNQVNPENQNAAANHNNKDIVNPRVQLVLATTITFLMAISIYNYMYQSSAIAVLSGAFGPPFAAFIILPLIVYSRNPDMVKYSLELYGLK